jgi:hypothetical protein
MPVEELPHKHYYVLRDRVTGHPEALAMNADLLRELAVRLREKRQGLDVDHDVPAVKPDRLAGYVYEFVTCHCRGKKANVAGKNIHFDLGFLTRLPHWNPDLFSLRLIDAGNLWWQPETDARLPDMETCAARVGLDVPMHRALADARDTVRLVRAWWARQRGASGCGCCGEGGVTRKPRLTEKQFQAQVVQLATLCGWRMYHTHDSRRSNPGFPDLILLRNSRAIAAELKTDLGRLTVEQLGWLAAFNAAGVAGVVWRPKDWDEIQRTLEV